MITFSCQICRSALSMDDQHAGQPVRCPTCKSVVHVPNRAPVSAVSAAGPGILGRPSTSYRDPVRRFGFNCPWCSSRLEATMATAGQEGQCPTCSKTIHIPILDRHGRLIDPESKTIIKPDPHPVHAYAAAGDRAPKILRSANGLQTIQCSRCNAMSPVSANSCKHCGIPFTLEGTVQTERTSSNGFATTSLVMGVLGIPTCMIFVPSVLAIIFGIIALAQIRSSGSQSSRATAIAGIACGAAGLLINGLIYLR